MGKNTVYTLAGQGPGTAWYAGNGAKGAGSHAGSTVLQSTGRHTVGSSLSYVLDPVAAITRFSE